MNTQDPKKKIQGPSLEQEIMRKKVQEFERALQDLQAKYGLVIVPHINVTQFGIMPDIIYMTKEAFDQQMKRGQMLSGMKAPVDN